MRRCDQRIVCAGRFGASSVRGDLLAAHGRTSPGRCRVRGRGRLGTDEPSRPACLWFFRPTPAFRAPRWIAPLVATVDGADGEQYVNSGPPQKLRVSAAGFTAAVTRFHDAKGATSETARIAAIEAVTWARAYMEQLQALLHPVDDSWTKVDAILAQLPDRLPPSRTFGSPLAADGRRPPRCPNRPQPGPASDR